MIERLNKKFKRRIKPMDIADGENACYMLLAFVSIKMELHWKSNPVGKVRENLLFFERLDDNNVHKVGIMRELIVLDSG